MLTDPLILTVAPNGAYKTHADHPAVPLTADALAATARDCLAAGAAMLHLHVRRGDGRHLLDARAYREATAAVRRAVGSALVVQITTESARMYGPAEQMSVVREVVPEAVSVALRELRAPGVKEAELAEFFGWLAQHRVMTQVILYDVADLADWQSLRRRGLIAQAPWFLLFVLGRYTAGQTSSPADLLPFLQLHEGAEPWAMCAFGALEHACAMAAASLGGHVRVGFENNLRLKDGRWAENNAALVRQAAEGAAVLGRPLATADQIRGRFLA